MFSVRRAAYYLFAASLSCLTACSAPPDKEIHQAQGALDAARAAGAEQYAREEFAAAQEALRRAADAVGERDYRLALSHALDSRERAETAAKEAGDQKAAARTAADRAVAAASTVLVDLRAKVKAADSAARPAPRTLVDARQTLSDTHRALQETRAVYERGDYARSLEDAKAVSERIETALRVLQAAPRTPAARRR